MGGTAASEAADLEVAMAVDETPQPASVAGSTMTAVRQGLVPGWLDRLAAIGWRVLVVIALALVFVALAGYLSMVTGAILVGVTVAAMVYPIVVRLQVRRGWPRARAAVAASFLAILIVVIALFVIIVAFIPSIVAIIQANQNGVAALTSFLTERGAPPAVLGVVDRAVDGPPGLARRRPGPAGRTDRELHHDHDPRRLPDVLPPRGWRPGVEPGDEQPG